MTRTRLVAELALDAPGFGALWRPAAASLVVVRPPANFSPLHRDGWPSSRPASWLAAVRRLASAIFQGDY